MINDKRIVPIQAIDLLTMYSVILALALDTAPEKLEVTGEPGVFGVSENSKTYLADEPVKELDFASGELTGTVYFVPALDFAGFKINGSAAATAGANISADGVTLYSAALASGTVTITKTGL